MDKWFLFNAKSGLWRVVKQPVATVTTHIQNIIDEAKETLLWKKNATVDAGEKKKFGECEKKYNDYYRLVGKGSFSTQILKLLQEYLYDGEFDRKLDTTKYQVAYTNGVLDLKTMQFRYGLRCSDFLTKTIGFDYDVALGVDCNT